MFDKLEQFNYTLNERFNIYIEKQQIGISENYSFLILKLK